MLFLGIALGLDSVVMSFSLENSSISLILWGQGVGFLNQVCVFKKYPKAVIM